MNGQKSSNGQMSITQAFGFAPLAPERGHKWDLVTFLLYLAVTSMFCWLKQYRMHCPNLRQPCHAVRYILPSLDSVVTWCSCSFHLLRLPTRSAAPSRLLLLTICGRQLINFVKHEYFFYVGNTISPERKRAPGLFDCSRPRASTSSDSYSVRLHNSADVASDDSPYLCLSKISEHRGKGFSANY